MIKNCYSCKELKEFYVCKSGVSSSYCKDCMKLRSKKEYKPEYRREYERKHRVERRKLEKKYYRNNQRKAIETYGGKCNCCGETEPLFLEIDHINGGGSKERKANKDIEGFYRKLIATKPQGFQVLCSNCNRGRWRNKGTCPHQTKDKE